ncbi:MAG: hypothetical protein V3T31_05135 [candidate division Zixibacteria bacterium]
MIGKGILKVRYAFVFCVVIASLCCVSIVAAQGQEFAGPVSSAEKALAIAEAYMGMEAGEAKRFTDVKTLRCGKLDDTETPFLKSLSDCQSVWCVTLEDYLPAHLNDCEDRNELMRDWQICIDSASGHLLKIESRRESIDYDSLCILTASEAEKKLLDGGEEYIEIPSSLPKARAREILGAVCQSGALHSDIARLQYVIRRVDGFDPRPVWILWLNGWDNPIPLKGGNVDWMPIYLRNRYRMIYSGETGNIQEATTVPLGQWKEGDRERVLGTGPK